MRNMTRVDTRWLLLIALACELASACSRQVPARARTSAPDLLAIRKLLEDQRQKLHMAGLAYAVVIDDRVVALEGLGMRDVAHQLPVTPDTLFPIGSCTKSFTAMAVAIASDEGKLTLDDSPHRYLPGLELQDREANELVTIRDMLAHRTGLMAKADLAATPGVLSRAQYLHAAIGARPAAKLRESFQYSNAMVTAVGEILAHVYQTSWERVIETKIFAPLGMTASRSSSYRLAGEAAVGYNWDGHAWRAAPVSPSLAVMAPAGAIASTARDLTRWLRVLTGGGTLDGKRLISPRLLDELTTPHSSISPTLSYGLGWAIYDWNRHRVIEHNGGSDGISALVSFMPDRHAGFVVLANSSPTPLTQIGSLGAMLWPLIIGETPVVANPAPSPKDLPPVDVVLARMMQAAGGEGNARVHKTMRLRATGRYEQQGVAFELVVLAREAARVEDERWTASGARLGRVRTYFDGARGAQQTTFGQDETTTDLAKARRETALHPLLDLRALYGSVALTEKTQLDGENVYVLALGTDTKLFVSARTGLVLRRERGGESTRFLDYRNLGGEVVPMTWVTHDALGDKIVEDRVERGDPGRDLRARGHARALISVRLSATSSSPSGEVTYEETCDRMLAGRADRGRIARRHRLRRGGARARRGGPRSR
jgi:CubicO group peptidase (beta-lactamase class C family)